MTDRFDKLEEEADAMLAGLNAPEAEPAEDSTPPIPEAEEPTAAEPETVTDEVAVESADAAPESETVAEAPPAQQEETVPLSRYKNAEKLMHQRAQEAADLRRRNAQLEAELQQLRHQAAPPANTTALITGDDDPDLKEFAEFYPEIAKPVTKQLQALKDQVERANARFAQLDETEQQAAQRAHWEAIYAAHPDASEIGADVQFQAWVAEQPPLFQMAVAQGSARDVNHVLDLYKAAMQPAPAAPSQPTPTPINKLAQAKQAAGPTVGRVPGQATNQQRFTRAQIAAMGQAEYEANEAEIDRQMALGMIA